MKSRLPIVTAAAVVLLALAACASMEWVSSPQPPVVKELAGVKTLGVACTAARTGANDHLLLKIGSGDFYNPIEITGVPYAVAILYDSPQAIKDFSVTPESLGALCRNVAVKLIADTGSFDYYQFKGLSVTRLMGRSIGGETAAGSYDTVVAIQDLVPVGSLTADAAARLGSSYGVDSILVIEPTVYGEIGQMTRQASKSGSMDSSAFKSGDFILRTWVKLEFRLYDGKSGAKISDSNAVKAQFDTMLPIGKDVYPLPVSSLQLARALVLSADYLKLFTDPMQKGILPYLTLFRPVYLATLQKTEQK
jgi:hypothetical protein